ncbi:hypothetical protein JTL32_16530 [Enterobacter cloacae]|nr:hypothetical protein [Enterobacter cloacae]
MTIVKRDKKSKNGGQSPQFRMRIDPLLRAQLDELTEAEGISLASWFKNLERDELKRKVIDPKG